MGSRRRRKGRGRYCPICEKRRPNEAFSGRPKKTAQGCKRCRRTVPPEKRDEILTLNRLWSIWNSSRMSDKTARILAKLADHPSAEVREVASVMHEVAKTVPFKRKRLQNLRRVRPDLLDRLEEVGWILPRWNFDEYGEPRELSIDDEFSRPVFEYGSETIVLILLEPPPF